MDELDKFLSEAFVVQSSSELQPEFTRKVMRNLPRQGVSAKTRNTILVTSALLALSVPLFNSGYLVSYFMSEEIVVEGILTVQYWMDQLGFMV